MTNTYKSETHIQLHNNEINFSKSIRENQYIQNNIIYIEYYEYYAYKEQKFNIYQLFLNYLFISTANIVIFLL